MLIYCELCQKCAKLNLKILEKKGIPAMRIIPAKHVYIKIQHVESLY
mgnify:CR=1 FL=1